jgi:hypothetical protein
MSTAFPPDRHEVDSVIVCGGPRPVFDTLKPVEVEAEPPATLRSVEQEMQALREKVVAQRIRTFAFAIGAAAFLAVVGVGGAGVVAKSETDRAIERVHRHVAAAEAALPNAAIELPPPVVPVVESAPAPTEETFRQIAPIPANGGTPKSLFLPPRARKHVHKNY